MLLKQRSCLCVLVTILFASIQIASATPLPLTDTEADAIVQAEADAKAERQKPRQQFHVIDHKIVEQKDGSRLIINRIKPPAHSVPKAKTPPRPVVQDDELLPAKPHTVLSISATVFDGQLTQLNWRHDGQTYTAYSNVDFNYLRGTSTIETPEAVYALMMGIGNETDLSSLPDLPDFTADELEYFVISDEGDVFDPDAFIGIDAIHTHFQENQTELKAQHQRTESLNAARKRHEAANPETPQETVINIWRKK